MKKIADTIIPSLELIISGNASYKEGTDYVPKTGLYQLHKGEAVMTSAEYKKLMNPLPFSVESPKSSLNPVNITVSNNVFEKREDIDYLTDKLTKQVEATLGRKVELAKGGLM
jgi:hypothetical protein